MGAQALYDSEIIASPSPLNAEKFMNIMENVFVKNYEEKYNYAKEMIPIDISYIESEIKKIPQEEQMLNELKSLYSLILQRFNINNYVLKNVNLDDYNQYVSNLTDSKIEEIIKTTEVWGYFPKYDLFMKYIPADDIKMMCYLYETYGWESLREYLDVIDDRINNALGVWEADEFASSV